MRAPTASSGYDIAARNCSRSSTGKAWKTSCITPSGRSGAVLLVHQRFHQLVLWHFLAFHQVLDKAVPPQELLNLTQVGLEVLEFLLRAEGFDHARRPFAVNWSPGCRGQRPTRRTRLRRF